MLAWEALTVTETQTGPLGGEGNQVTSGDRSGESVRGKALWAGSWHCLSRHLVENKIVCWLPFSVTHKWSPCYSILCEQFCWPPWRDKVVARGAVRTRSCFHLNVYIISMLCCSPPPAAYRISRSQAPWGRKEGMFLRKAVSSSLHSSQAATVPPTMRGTAHVYPSSPHPASGCWQSSQGLLFKLHQLILKGAPALQMSNFG